MIYRSVVLEGANMIKQVSRILFKPTEKLTIKLSVGLLDSYNNDSFYNLFEANPYDYLTINLSANINIQYKTPEPWDRSQTVHISDQNIYYWNRMIQMFYQKIQKPELYTYYKSGKIEHNGDESYKMPISLKGGEYIEFEPGIIVDEKGSELPGIMMRINVKEHQVELSFDEFESMMYLFSRINIGSEAMQLVIMKLMLDDKIADAKKNQIGGDYVPERSSVSIFQNRNEIREEEKESVVDNRRIEQTVTSLDDL